MERAPHHKPIVPTAPLYADTLQLIADVEEDKITILDALRQQSVQHLHQRFVQKAGWVGTMAILAH